MLDFVSEVLNDTEAYEATGPHEGKASKANYQESSVGVILRHNAPPYQGHA